jgi:hypothetical protein
MLIWLPRDSTLLFKSAIIRIRLAPSRLQDNAPVDLRFSKFPIARKKLVKPLHYNCWMSAEIPLVSSTTCCP